MVKELRVRSPPVAVIVLNCPVEAVIEKIPEAAPLIVGLTSIGWVRVRLLFNCPVPVCAAERIVSNDRKLLAICVTTFTWSEVVANTRLKMGEVVDISEVCS